MGAIQVGDRPPMGAIQEVGDRPPVGAIQEVGDRPPTGAIQEVGDRPQEVGDRSPRCYMMWMVTACTGACVNSRGSQRCGWSRNKILQTEDTDRPREVDRPSAVTAEQKGQT